MKGDGLEFRISFTRRGWLSDAHNFDCTGELVSNPKFKVVGKWNDSLTMDGQLVW